MIACKKCQIEKSSFDFYKKDSTCKECRKEMVRRNRAEKVDYYREYDKKRYKEDPKVKERIDRYQATPSGIEKTAEAKRRWESRNPVKKAAQTILGNAVRDGKVPKPGFCEECGKAGRIHGHHDDYARPLEVKWLCPKCHSDWHKENGEGANG